MFVRFRPMGALLYEHMFCLPRTSQLAQRAREALLLARAFLLLEDDDPVDWEVGQEEPAPTSHEPEWAHAHRAPLHERRAPRRGGQPAPPPQLCLCPIQPSGLCARPAGGNREADRSKIGQRGAQRGSRITTGSSRVAIDL
jgi:hypothetical protein